jgi:hypothetical protein
MCCRQLARPESAAALAFLGRSWGLTCKGMPNFPPLHFDCIDRRLEKLQYLFLPPTTPTALLVGPVASYLPKLRHRYPDDRDAFLPAIPRRDIVSALRSDDI